MPATGKPGRGAGAVRFRSEVRAADQGAVRQLVTATGFFEAHEIDIAEELVVERLARGEASGYFFGFADVGEALAGYACYGPSDHLLRACNLYWIAVAPERQGQGLGKALLARAEGDMARQGGRRILIETSSKALYLPTRRFYEACGYRRMARLADHYAPGDDLLVYEKWLPGQRAGTGLRSRGVALPGHVAHLPDEGVEKGRGDFPLVDRQP